MRAIIYNSRGETLMEGIVSILIFVVAIATVTTMIMLSLRITSDSSDDANAWQNQTNAVLFGDETNPLIENTGNIMIEFSIGSETLSVPAKMFSSGEFTAFMPMGAGP